MRSSFYFKFWKRYRILHWNYIRSLRKKEIARGGRYDDLLQSLGAKNIPAVGAAINLNNL